MNDQERQLIDEMLAPLRQISPARRDRGRSIERRHRKIALVFAAFLLLLVLGATWTALDLTASPKPTPDVPGGSLGCLKLVGGDAAHAAQVLSERGYEVHWGLATYEPPNGQMFVRRLVPTVGASDVVEEIELDQTGAVLVFVHQADDLYAPPVNPPDCP
jgi:hypothetical protein